MTDTNARELLALQEAVAGRYFVERELGRGGMGVVYLARDLSLDRLVAIKLLPPDLAASSDLRARFLREARTAAQLSHPHIVPIHAVEEHEAVVFFVMGYVDGETLGNRVRRGGPLGNSEAMRLMQEVAWALAHAHSRGVVHRDVKPDNILVERDSGRALVTDFGIARAGAATTPAGGVAIGTPQYMSPEQARGEGVDARSDLYSLGATFFFALTGRLAVDAPSPAALMIRLTTEAAPSIAGVRSVVPVPLARMVDRCLARKPDQRFSSAAELAEALRNAMAARPDTPPVVRAFLGELDAAGSEAGTAVVATVMSAASTWSFRNDLFSGLLFYAIPPVLGLLAGLRVARLTAQTRAFLRTGYTLGDVRRGIAVEQRAQLEHDGVRPSWSATTTRWLVGGAVATAAGVAFAHSNSNILSFLGLGTAIYAPTVTLRRVLHDWLGGTPLLRRLTQGNIGTLLFGVAKLGLRSQIPTRIAGAEPTVVAIARAADRLYAALPDARRHGLGDVQGTINRLEAEALALAGNPDETPRHASAVAALDALRLDLLRLGTVGLSSGELTREIEEADDIGRRIDAQLEAEEEVTPVP